MLALAVNVNQGLGDLFQHSQINRAAIHPTKTAAGAPNLATQDQDIRLVTIQPFSLQNGVDSRPQLPGQAKTPFDPGSTAARSNEGSVSPSTQQHRHRVDNDRFTGPRFARQHVETWVKSEAEFINDSKIRDVQFEQHDYDL